MPKRKRSRIERKIKKDLIKRLLNESEDFKTNYENLKRLTETEHTPVQLSNKISTIIDNLFAEDKYQIVVFNYLNNFKLEFQPDIRKLIQNFRNMPNKEISSILFNVLELILEERFHHKEY